jgi:hypothetical protein
MPQRASRKKKQGSPSIQPNCGSWPAQRALPTSAGLRDVLVLLYRVASHEVSVAGPMGYERRLYGGSSLVDSARAHGH